MLVVESLECEEFAFSCVINTLIQKMKNTVFALIPPLNNLHTIIANYKHH